MQAKVKNAWIEFKQGNRKVVGTLFPSYLHPGILLISVQVVHRGAWRKAGLKEVRQFTKKVKSEPQKSHFSPYQA